MTSSLFEQLGYATVYRDSAEEALSLLADGTKIDLVFSDIVMPGTIDGVGLTTRNPVALSQCSRWSSRPGTVMQPKQLLRT